VDRNSAPGVNGRVKVSQRAAQNVATLGLQDCRLGVRQHPGDRAYHRAGGCPDALARKGQLLSMCVWVKPCLVAPCSGPSDSFRRSSQGCSHGGSGGREVRR